MGMRPSLWPGPWGLPLQRWLPWATQAEAARGLIGHARLLTAVSWLTYPAVYIVKMLGINSATAMAAEQIGYSIADVVAKAVFGVLIWSIAVAKSDAMEKDSLLP